MVPVAESWLRPARWGLLQSTDLVSGGRDCVSVSSRFPERFTPLLTRSLSQRGERCHRPGLFCYTLSVPCEQQHFMKSGSALSREHSECQEPWPIWDLALSWRLFSSFRFSPVRRVTHALPVSYLFSQFYKGGVCTSNFFFSFFYRTKFPFASEHV